MHLDPNPEFDPDLTWHLFGTRYVFTLDYSALTLCDCFLTATIIAGLIASYYSFIVFFRCPEWLRKEFAVSDHRNACMHPGAIGFYYWWATTMLISNGSIAPSFGKDSDLYVYPVSILAAIFIWVGSHLYDERGKREAVASTKKTIIAMPAFRPSPRRI